MQNQTPKKRERPRKEKAEKNTIAIKIIINKGKMGEPRKLQGKGEAIGEESE